MFSIRIPIQRLTSGEAQAVSDFVSIEEPLEIRLADRSISITMRTPGHDEELAAGFLFSEGVVKHRTDIEHIKSCGPLLGDHQGQNVVRVVPALGLAIDSPQLTRHFYTTSSCGICGKASLELLEAHQLTAFPFGGERISTKLIQELPHRLQRAQPTFSQTGGLHAAALFSYSGELQWLREDVGRHNAVDKLIGRRFLDGDLPLSDSVLVLSGRVSFELMQKALMAGARTVVAVGAPSSLAVELAKRFNVTLIGFVREGRFNLYHGGDRLCPA